MLLLDVLKEFLSCKPSALQWGSGCGGKGDRGFALELVLKVRAGHLEAPQDEESIPSARVMRRQRDYLEPAPGMGEPEWVWLHGEGWCPPVGSS